MYHPEDTDSLFNIAYVYGRKYCDELRKQGQKDNLKSDNRLNFIGALRQAVQDQPKMKEKISAKWFVAGTGLECLGADTETQALIASSADAKKEPPPKWDK